MSAEIHQADAFDAYCADCASGYGPVSEEDAEFWATEHNNEYHASGTPTYEVQGGQGHMIITRGLTYDDAVEYARKFDRDTADLNLPPTRIVKEQTDDH